MQTRQAGLEGTGEIKPHHLINEALWRRAPGELRGPSRTEERQPTRLSRTLTCIPAGEGPDSRRSRDIDWGLCLWCQSVYSLGVRMMLARRAATVLSALLLAG